ncbi:phospholipid transfer protein C2CD2L-like isoform X7 [Dreissena polymorpha]|uniref:phospholipid transfer protein C2CD2L-like isoform X7 n=1 Tax=Dreissena polymorpha TaxID=45954 RepID=UPI002265210A|nr:phospholipid transfer protein C2CD2L-like isoform X7 [Dreissena polymorpha]
MADITLKLIWYKLGETYTKMAEAGANMSWFSWEEHFLDCLLVFWISSGLLIVGVVNSLTTFFGPLQPRISWRQSKDGGTSSPATPQGPTGPESTQWLNSALNWLYLHYDQFPEFVDAWIQALNEQANKLGGPVQIKFEKVQSGSLPPKFGEVTFDSGPEDKYVLNCRVDSRDLSFAVFASQQTHEGVKLTNLVITVLKLRGQLKIRCFRQGNDMMAEVGFLGRPDVKVQGKPVNPYMDPSDMVDVGVAQEVVRNTLCLASTTINLSQWMGVDKEKQTIPIRRTESNKVRTVENVPISPSSPRQQQQMSEVFEAQDVPQQQHSAFHVPTLATPTKVPTPQRVQARGPRDKQLLVKVIKASGLKQNEGPIDPYCVMYLDSPAQTEVSNVVKNTFNPFWDEQFYYEITRDTQEIRFEVLDKKRPSNDNFLGEAIVYMEDLQRNPSSRQIIPLQGRLGAGEFVSGSITVEFLLADASPHNSLSSPQRTIETNKAMTPGGTIVTSTMTTTKRPHNYETNVDGSPSYIQTRTFDYSSTNQDPGLSEVVHINGVESVTETAIRALKERSKLAKKPSTRTSTLIITGVKREPAIPKIKMAESPPSEVSNRSTLSNMSSPESPEIAYPPQAKGDQRSRATSSSAADAPTGSLYLTMAQ